MVDPSCQPSNLDMFPYMYAYVHVYVHVYAYVYVYVYVYAYDTYIILPAFSTSQTQLEFGCVQEV